MLIHKETVFQPADSGIPAHWAVQYWDNESGSSFCQAAYFSLLDDAIEFEETLIHEN